ncbi:MAG TPA: hypothetical protein DDW87_13245, partial [Firmicutes bacterium]|nr:hypothetical protein [Bacillota bacterium]
RGLSVQDLYELALPYWQKAGFLPAEVSPEAKEHAQRILEQLQSRIKLMADVAESAQFFFVDDYPYQPKVVQKILTKPHTEAILKYVYGVIQDTPELDEEHVKPLFQVGMQKFGIKMGDLIQPLRVALTGTNI